MNKNQETKQIKVNNGPELIQKAKEYKNSGGEWKLLEKYLEIADGKVEKRKRKLGWGIIISNGEQTIDIFSTKAVHDGDEINVRTELCQIFPELQSSYWASDQKSGPYGDGIGRPIQSKLDNETHKSEKKDNETYDSFRHLVAENFRHLELIIRDYFRENEAKIYNFPNRDFSNWVEIIDGQDGNMYLYVGEKNDGGGREIKIGIEKAEFEKKKNRSVKGDEKHSLEVCWGLLIISASQPLTPAEKERYYKQLEEEFQEQWPYREKLCRKYWEGVCERMEEKFNYYYEKTGQNQYWNHEANEQGILAKSRVAEIKEELSKNTNIKTCCDNDCSHDLSKKDYSIPTSPKSNNQNNQISDNEKSQLLQYFIAKSIQKISLKNGKLIIEYKNNTKKVIESEDQELTKYHQLIQNLPSKSLSLSELQQNNTNNPSTPSKNNTGIYIGLAIGAFILGGIFVYFLVHKKKKNNKK